MKSNQRKATEGTAVPYRSFDAELGRYALASRPATPEVETAKAAWRKVGAGLQGALKEQVEANAPVALTITPVLLAECWERIVYIAERDGLSIHEAAAKIIEHGINAEHAAECARLASAA